MKIWWSHLSFLRFVNTEFELFWIYSHLVYQLSENQWLELLAVFLSCVVISQTTEIAICIPVPDLSEVESGLVKFRIINFSVNM